MHVRLFETFPVLEKLPVYHAFTRRIPGVDVKADREIALARLESIHGEIIGDLGLSDRRYITAQQVHGADVAVVDAKTASPVQAVDGLISNDPGVCLGIYVADCGPVWLVDPVKRVIGCVHSGRKGTDLGVVPAAIAKMESTFGCSLPDIVVQIGPCIRPPHYEVDFAAIIRTQCVDAGVTQVFDCGTCTAENPVDYYSYRMELGKTGRMVALIALR